MDFEVESKLILDGELEKALSVQNDLVYLPSSLYDAGISPGAFKLLTVIIKFAAMDKNRDRAFPTRNRLAKIMHVTDRHIDKLKLELKNVGILDWTKEPGKTEGHWHNVYHLRFAVKLGEQKFSHSPKVPPTNRVGGLTPPPTLKAAGDGDSPKKNKRITEKKFIELADKKIPDKKNKRITEKKFIELADKKIPDWKTHYKISYEEGVRYCYGISETFSNWLYKEKDYQGNNFDEVYSWERKFELLVEFSEQ